MLPSTDRAWALFALQPETALTLGFARALQRHLKTQVLHVRLQYSRTLTVTVCEETDEDGADNKGNEGDDANEIRCGGEMCWPARTSTASLAGADVNAWPHAVLPEEILEFIAKQCGVPEGWAVLPSRGWRHAGLSPIELVELGAASKTDAAPREHGPPSFVLAGARGAAARPHVHALARRGPPWALAVFDPGTDLSQIMLPEHPDLHVLRQQPPLRWGRAGLPTIAIRAEGSFSSRRALKLLEAWLMQCAARSDLQQALMDDVDYNPLLQRDHTPWEAAWSRPAVIDRDPNWASDGLRGWAKFLVWRATSIEKLGPPPPGVAIREVEQLGSPPGAKQMRNWLIKNESSKDERYQQWLQGSPLRL